MHLCFVVKGFCDMLFFSFCKDCAHVQSLFCKPCTAVTQWSRVIGEVALDAIGLLRDVQIFDSKTTSKQGGKREKKGLTELASLQRGHGTGQQIVTF